MPTLHVTFSVSETAVDGNVHLHNTGVADHCVFYQSCLSVCLSVCLSNASIMSK